MVVVMVMIISFISFVCAVLNQRKTPQKKNTNSSLAESCDYITLYV